MTRALRDVVTAAVPSSDDLPALLDVVAAALDGAGPAVRLVTREPSAARTVTDAMTDAITDAVTDVDDDVAAAVATSGSTGEARTVLLPAAALRASATATHRRLAGPGRWLLALPVDHVAGLQVLVRSALAGTVPVVLPPGPFAPDAFVVAAAGLGTGPRYVSLVPTQLVRLVEDRAGLAALAGFDAVLLGGAATPGPLLARARAAGVRVVTTYGMTETCGGCVYDGQPLDGVAVHVDDDGRVLLAGDVLAAGYAGRPDLDAAAFVLRDGRRHLRTSDLGRLDDGVLTVLGRADDVIVTGGVNVAPAAVEEALAGAPGVGQVCVVGVPDDEWGQQVVAVVVPARDRVPVLDELRATVRDRLGAAHAPRRLVVVDSLPVRGPGKPDRSAAARLALAPSSHPTRRPL